MATATLAERTGRSLVADVLFARLVDRVVDDANMDRELAERVVDQAIAFLATCAAYPGARFSPSRAVDEGWHAFILHTRAYADFCHRIAGHFIHHEPNEVPAMSKCHPCHEEGCSASGEDGNENGGKKDPGCVLGVKEAMATAGFLVDAELWSDTIVGE
jgi:hypothetical protein